MSYKKLYLIAAWTFTTFLAALFLSPLRRIHPHDFMQMYFAGRLVRSGQISQLYSKAAYQPLIAELRATGERMSAIDCHYFNRPAFAALLFVPFSKLPYPWASWGWIAVNFSLLCVLVWKLPVWFNLSASIRPWLFAFYPFLWSIGFGQDTIPLTLIAAYGLHLAASGKDSAAGALLGVTVFKPHLVWLLPLGLAAAGRRKVAAVFVLVAAVLAALSVWAVGPAGVRSYIGLLQAPTTDYVPQAMGNLRALWLYFGPAVGVIASILVLGSFLTALRWGSPPDKLAATLLAGILVSPHTYPQDYSLMALAAILSGHPAVRCLVLLPWPYFLATRDARPMSYVAIACLSYVALRALFSAVPALTASRAGRFATGLWGSLRPDAHVTHRPGSPPDSGCYLGT